MATPEQQQRLRIIALVPCVVIGASSLLLPFQDRVPVLSSTGERLGSAQIDCGMPIPAALDRDTHEIASAGYRSVNGEGITTQADDCAGQGRWKVARGAMASSTSVWLAFLLRRYRLPRG